MPRRPRTPGLLPLPHGAAALRAELARIERELGATSHPQTRKLLAIELRRAIFALEFQAA